ncbi:MAG TPA: NADH-quinone oxidoreductase subunit C [Nocardioidaceae bacterium]|nr:NADH-quinone oxidoreductase subunit C [Nocardioidaceae bacterium]
MSTSTDLWPGRVLAAFGEPAVVDEGFGPIQVDVPAEQWAASVSLARTGLGCRFFDFLTAVDEGLDGLDHQQRFRIVCHVAAHRRDGVQHLILRTLVTDRVASVAHVYAGARWHERETAEMFGVVFTDTEGSPIELEGLLLPEGFEGHPLRKDFVLASRVAKPWPGAKEPGESDHDAPARRRTLPPGVPEDWGTDA